MMRRQTSEMAPWLSVRGAASAVEFYQAAFGATVVYRLEADGLLVRLAIGASEFWVAEESPQYSNFSPATLGGGTTRFVLLVADPDAAVARAVAAGATVFVPVKEFHGWRVGRVADPFGHHWEVSLQLTDDLG